MMHLTDRLRRIRLLGDAYRRVRTLAQGPGWGGFHRDPIYRGLVLDLLNAFPFTSFVETGTFHGYSTELVASRFPALPTYSAEVVQSTYDEAHKFLRKYPNLHLARASSDEWVAGLLKSGQTGAMPFFYLDAHWQTYWPLRAELRHIADAAVKAVVVIDDFEVPGRPDFGFDIDGGGERTAGHPCNLEYVRPSLAPANRYRALFPKYAHRDAFGDKPGAFRGHVVLFQNMDEEYEAALRLPHLARHYEAHGVVEPART